MLRFRQNSDSMRIIFIICKVITVWSYDGNTSDRELNRVDNDVTPFYHTIVINDLAEIMNEMDNNMVPQIGDIFPSNSASDENIEELLSEYQHYLDKAQKQRKKFLEKNKTKNKVPILRQDPFKKQNSNSKINNNEIYFPIGDVFEIKPFQYTYTIPNNVDFIIPMNSIPSNYNIKTDNPAPESKGQFNEEDSLKGNTITLPESKNFVTQTYDNDPSRKYYQAPCECSWGDCSVQCPNQKSLNTNTLDKEVKSFARYLPNFENVFKDIPKHKSGRGMADDNSGNTMNIRMKIDIQLPKRLENNPELCTNCAMQRNSDDFDINPSVINALFPYYNFPMPYETFGQNVFKLKTDSYSPMHKITIHKKRKSRFNNINKKHRKKGAISYQNYNINGQQEFPSNIEGKGKIELEKKNENDITYQINSTVPALATPEDATNLNSSIPRQELSLTVNLTFNSDNQTSPDIKLGNSVDETTENDSKTTIEDISMNSLKSRDKREIGIKNINTLATQAETHISDERNKNKKFKKSKDLVDLNKNIISDEELLYWPDSSKNINMSNKLEFSKITLESENERLNLNIGKQLVHSNDSKILYDVIVQKVDWNNMDTVATLFMSLFGKYFNGIITFCSDNSCVSIKCNEKTCIHRSCLPENRHNQKGHCYKSNTPDRSASVEYPTDLSANAAFEVVNIIGNKLLGKIFGKGTFCINSKCITIVSTKKTFLKAKCSTKELNEEGHCFLFKT